MEEVKEEKIKEEKEVFTDQIGDILEYTAVKRRIKKMHIYYALRFTHIYITITRNSFILEVKRDTGVKNFKYKAKFIKTLNYDKPYNVMFSSYIYYEIEQWGLEEFIKKTIEYLKSWTSKYLFPF
ncbi:MAG: hypothetical protein ACP5HH_07355 [Fervidicoccaceae archaeon]